jgi:hypothetical protein
MRGKGKAFEHARGPVLGRNQSVGSRSLKLNSFGQSVPAPLRVEQTPHLL